MASSLHLDRDATGPARWNLTSGALAAGGRVKEERRHENSLRRLPVATKSPRSNRAIFAPAGRVVRCGATAGGASDERMLCGPVRVPLWVGSAERARPGKHPLVAPRHAAVGREVAWAERAAAESEQPESRVQPGATSRRAVRDRRTVGQHERVNGSGDVPRAAGTLPGTPESAPLARASARRWRSGGS